MKLPLSILISLSLAACIGAPFTPEDAPADAGPSIESVSRVPDAGCSSGQSEVSYWCTWNQSDLSADGMVCKPEGDAKAGPWLCCSYVCVGGDT